MNDIKKEDFPIRLKKIMNDKQITQAELSKITKITASSISDWLNRKYEAKQDKIDIIATALNISPAWLLGYNVPIEKNTISNIPNIIPLDKSRRIPILGRIACGEPIFAEENFEGYFIADASIKASFILRAKGDSMIDANIHDGDLVFIKKDFEIINGNIYAVLIEEEATLKRVNRLGGKFILNPANSNYQPIILDGSKESMILGEMVGVYNVRSK